MPRGNAARRPPETISSSAHAGPGQSADDSDTSAAAASSGPTTLVRPPRPSAGIVRLRDIARVEMGAANYTQAQTFDGHQSVGIAVFQLPGTNALDVADRVKRKMRELKERFPEGIDYDIAYDITPFIRESVADVVKTLFEAVGLVGLVVLVFLQNWRSVLIPMIAVPVAIIGTFAAMAVVGFSLNNISLFGLVLAIGIVVDDAIVVVENVDRWLDHGLPPREAARKAMTEVTGPIIAVALVLCAVFVPCAFISGITGPLLPAVRRDHRRFHRLLGHQLADAQPGPGRDPAAEEREPHHGGAGRNGLHGVHLAASWRPCRWRWLFPAGSTPPSAGPPPPMPGAWEDCCASTSWSCCSTRRCWP